MNEKTVLIALVLLTTITGCQVATSSNDLATEPADRQAQTVEPVVAASVSTETAIAIAPEETIAPISEDFPSIDDPSSALFYENHANYAFRRDSEDRRSDLDRAYRAISIAAKLYKSNGRDEEYRRTIDTKQQIVAEQRSSGYR